MAQDILHEKNSLNQLTSIVEKLGIDRLFLVHDGAYPHLGLSKSIAALPIPVTFFDRVLPNPRYEHTVEALELFRQAQCNGILAIGGGSVIDVAKCVKYYAEMPVGSDYIHAAPGPMDTPLIAIPTTAGTGSESTRFAVVYYDGEKMSIDHPRLLPNAVLLDARLLQTLPLYQKKSALLDALSQGIESRWSVKSTPESMAYAKEAILTLTTHMDAYLAEPFDLSAATEILRGANLAGQAINITQTTAAHAMSYKLTSVYGIAHGHAVALCLPKVWRRMAANLAKCTDERGADYLEGVFEEIAAALGADTIADAIAKWEGLLASLGMSAPVILEAEAAALAKAVNAARLGNNPVALDHDAIRQLYLEIGGMKHDA